jgi:hypothetical protein
MNFETLTRMDAEADELIKSWSSGPFSENASIETCTQKMGIRLNGVYGAAISPDLIAEYGRFAGQWVIDQVPGLVFGYAVSKVGNALKQVYHDKANGKEAPKPEEFRKYVLHVSPAVVRVTASEISFTGPFKPPGH